MNDWLSGISVLISDNHSWGYFFAFLFAFLEALPIFGTIIPGLIIIPFIGLYIGNGVLPALTTFHFTFLGAFVGDVLSFWLGQKYNEVESTEEEKQPMLTQAVNNDSSSSGVPSTTVELSSLRLKL